MTITNAGGAAAFVNTHPTCDSAANLNRADHCPDQSRQTQLMEDGAYCRRRRRTQVRAEAKVYLLKNLQASEAYSEREMRKTPQSF
ncbi:hypothetical protein NQZ68_040001 [Dissostichus eleginoides]|nr:hypothetical protein NQZ68_040001 [Dissostichus eleginoides]